MNLIDTFNLWLEYPKEFLFCLFLAALPAFIWIWIFYSKHKERKLEILLAFLFGIGSAAIILIYQSKWGQIYNFLFFDVEPTSFASKIDKKFGQSIWAPFFLFMSVGFIEEYLKHWVVKVFDWTGKTVNKSFFRSINDVIEFSIVAAIGFAFLENIGYFYRLTIMMQSEPDKINKLMRLFVMRSLFVVFIHVLCSGIYGYFYGLGYFAKPVMDDEKKEGKKFFIPNFIHNIFHFKSVTPEKVFHYEMISLGLIISFVLHGLYDFFLEINTTIGSIMANWAYKMDAVSFIPIDVFNIKAKGPVFIVGDHYAVIADKGMVAKTILALDNIYFHHIILPMILIIGMFYLDGLMEKDEDKKVFGHKVKVEVFT